MTHQTVPAGVPDTSKKAPIMARLTPYATVFVSSACIMVVELVAGRLVSQYIGQSLYTWTAIIGVVLAGISVGNYVGGRIADHWWGRLTLALQFIAAGAGCLSVLPLNHLAGNLAVLEALPWPVRILGHVSFAFLLPAALLGTISPVIARRALLTHAALGRTVGNVYAWATAGSIMGTFLTGYYLVMWLDTISIVAGSAAILTGLGLCYLVGALMRRGGEAEVPGPQEGIPSPGVNPGLWGMAGPIATVFLANAVIMIIEMVAGRMISRHYGHSIYTWTNVIGVILIGMTLGSHMGGRLADRFEPRRLLMALLVMASASTLAAVSINRLLVSQRLLVSLDWSLQISAHVVVAFALSSILLGATAPVVVRWALTRRRAAGSTIGVVYAWGSIGSIAGTFFAGYWLIAAVGAVPSLYLAALSLAVMALAFGLRHAGAWGWLVACVFGVSAALAPVSPLREIGSALLLRPTAPPNVIYVDESQYSYIAISQDPKDPNVRSMTLDRLIHSVVNMDNPKRLCYEYEWIYDAVLSTLYPGGQPLRTLFIGGGGYVFPRYLELTRPSSHIEVAEIDPAVTEAAYAAFGLPRDSTVDAYNMDARNRVSDLIRQQQSGRLTERFDCIFGDSFNDYSVPYHLTTREFNELLRRLLKDDGIYMLNLIDSRQSALFLGTLLHTLRQTFSEVYLMSSMEHSYTRDTFIAVCSNRPLDLTALPGALRMTYNYRGELFTSADIDGFVEKAGRRVLTDTFTPVDNLLAPIASSMQINEYVKECVSNADALLGANDFDGALRECQRGLRENPYSPEAHEVMGLALLAKQDVPGAVAALRKSVEINPSRDSAHTNLGSALAASGDVAAAVAAWNKAIAVNPNATAAYERMGVTLVNAGNPAGAVPILTRAVELNDTLPTRISLAVAHYKSGNIEQAIQELTTVLQRDPEQPVQQQLAIAYWAAHKYDDAVRHLDLARQKGQPVDPNFAAALARDAGKQP